MRKVLSLIKLLSATKILFLNSVSQSILNEGKLLIFYHILKLYEDFCYTIYSVYMMGNDEYKYYFLLSNVFKIIKHFTAFHKKEDFQVSYVKCVSTLIQLLVHDPQRREI